MCVQIERVVVDVALPFTVGQQLGYNDSYPAVQNGLIVARHFE